MEQGLVRRLKCCFEISSYQYVANSCGMAASGDDVSRERFAVLRRLLLIVFQRARNLDEEDWTSEALNEFLAAVINLW